MFFLHPYAKTYSLGYSIVNWREKVFPVYLLTFCRVAVGLVFAVSSASKLFTLSQFQQTIAHFGLLPNRLHGIAALLFLSGEIGVVALVALGGQWLFSGFVLALVLFLVFCGALASVVVRKIQTPCNCFGASAKPVTPMDIW